MLPLHGPSASSSRRSLSLRTFLRATLIFGTLSTAFFYFDGPSRLYYHAAEIPQQQPIHPPPPEEVPAHPQPPPPPPPLYPEPDAFPPFDDGPEDWPSRAAAVKRAFLHAYHSYEQGAFPADELKPLTNESVQNFNGWGVSVVDSLDTMLLMDCKEEFDRALKHVAAMKFTMPPGQFASFFETVIRYLGGLLSAYNLSQEPILLQRAEELGRKLLLAFNTTSGLPHAKINPETGLPPSQNDKHALLAEIASCQMEYKYLAHLTGYQDFFLKPNKVMDILEREQNANGLWTSFWNTFHGNGTNQHFSVGAWADSGYEYVLKQYLLSGRTESRFKDMYLKSINGILSKMVFLSETRDLLYVTDVMAAPTGNLEHLSCFFPGLLALGAHLLPLTPEEKELHEWAAKGITHTCYLMYAEQVSGLGPEMVQFGAPKGFENRRWLPKVEEWKRAGRPGGAPPGVGKLAERKMMGTDKTWKGRDYYIRNHNYLARPETIESIYLMWKTTGDPIWRERGWEIFTKIERHMRRETGYCSLRNVLLEAPQPMNEMPSYFLAETVKYLYLLFLDTDPWPLDKFVFTTEAHPLPVFEWKPWEMEAYGIS